jgi:chromosome segregation ATPase
MTGYKEYRSVTEFPLHVEKLNRDDLEAVYQELRNSYRSLVLSRGQLVRRQTEAKAKLSDINQSFKQLSATFEKVQHEKVQLQKALSHSVEVQKQLEGWGNDLAKQVIDLNRQMDATTQLLGEFEAVYEEVQEDKGILTLFQRLQRLLKAAHKLLNTDIKELVSAKRLSPEKEEWTKETPANINRSLLDE